MDTVGHQTICASRTIHFSTLPDGKPGSNNQDWNVYRREVGRLLAEGNEGRWVLIQGEEIVGIWDTELRQRWFALSAFPSYRC